MLARRPATAVTDPPFRLTVSSLARRGFAIADWIIAPVPPGGKGAVELNSTVDPCSDPDQGTAIPVTGSRFPVPITREFSQKAQ
jgi:hypothetical protein